MILLSVITGILATALMTVFMYLVTFLTRRPYKVVKILGTILTFQTTEERGLSDKPSAIIIGIIAHYFVGILFAYVFFNFIKENALDPKLAYALVFGLGAGVLGILVWKIIYILHPYPPRIPLREYFVNLMIGHFLFGLGMWLSYNWYLNSIGKAFGIGVI